MSNIPKQEQALNDEEVGKLYAYCPKETYDLLRRLVKYGQIPEPPLLDEAPVSSNQNTGSDPNAQGPSPLDLLQRKNERLRAALHRMAFAMNGIERHWQDFALRAISGDSPADETSTRRIDPQIRARMLADEELGSLEFEQQAERIAREAHEDRVKLWESLHTDPQTGARLSVETKAPLCGVTSLLDTKCGDEAGHGGRHTFAPKALAHPMPVMYVPCEQHKGGTFTMTIQGHTQLPIQVCPGCETEKK